MRAVRLIKAGQPLQAQEIPVPTIGPSDVLVRVKAAGICHSDAHYRAGVSKVSPLPLTLGHEISGVVEMIGDQVKNVSAGDRVCVHYLDTCGHCHSCFQGQEQFCSSVKMIGKQRDGGYAEFAAVPARSVFHLPKEITFAEGAIMMCSSATSFHALNKARLKTGETVAVFGFGGLGFSALQLAKASGSGEVYVVDVNVKKLRLAEKYGAIAINATKHDAVKEIQRLTKGRGVDVSLELIGLPITMDQSVRCLATLGRAALVGLTKKTFPVAPYANVINKEAEIIGVSDHLASEIPLLTEMVRTGKLKFGKNIIRTIPLEAKQINATLDKLQKSTDQIRTVICPT